MLSNALALMLDGMACVSYFVHVAGKANPADLTSRVPFIVNSHGKLVLDLLPVVDPDPDPDQQLRDVIAEKFLKLQHPVDNIAIFGGVESWVFTRSHPVF